MDKALIAFAGAAAGVLLAWIKSYVDYLTQSKRELYVAALACRDRLAKIEYAVRELEDETRSHAHEKGWRSALTSLGDDDWRRQTIDNELEHLGADLDHYRKGIAPIRSIGLRKTHLRISDELTELLIKHDLDRIGRHSKSIDNALRRMPFFKRRLSITGGALLRNTPLLKRRC
jgi:hypothetical protein